MQDPANELPRIPLPRTSLNRDLFIENSSPPVIHSSAVDMSATVGSKEIKKFQQGARPWP